MGSTSLRSNITSHIINYYLKAFIKMKKLILTTLAAFCLTVSASAQLLYKVTADSVAKPSYIVATHDLLNPMGYVGAINGLTAEQQDAAVKINQAIDAQRAQSFLLQGITGSGKTEVYLRAAAHAVDAGWQVLMLVPEIALTAQLVKRFQAWFGSEIAVAHSKLSQNERGDVWYLMRTGKARVLIGVRSAVFAPFEKLGLVIVKTLPRPRKHWPLFFAIPSPM